MRQFFSFLALIVFFSSCDDGDLEQVTFEFDDSSADACNLSENPSNFFIYKATDKRAMLLKIGPKNFPNTLTQDTLNGNPIEINLSETNQLIYRVYSDEITSNTICTSIPPANPIVTEERIATGGTVYIRTEAIKTDIVEDGSNRISEYRHTVSFSDVTFRIENGEQRNESLPSMVYTRAAPRFLAFNNSNAVNTCGGNKNFLYRYNSSDPKNAQALTLRLSDAAVAELFTQVLDTPKVYALNDAEGDENILSHIFYKNTTTNPLSESYFCAAELPIFPGVKDIWNGETGAQIEVITTQVSPTTVRHTVTLKNVKMVKQSQFFFLKTNFVFGYIEEAITTP